MVLFGALFNKIKSGNLFYKHSILRHLVQNHFLYFLDIAINVFFYENSCINSGTRCYIHTIVKVAKSNTKNYFINKYNKQSRHLGKYSIYSVYFVGYIVHKSMVLPNKNFVVCIFVRHSRRLSLINSYIDFANNKDFRGQAQK